MGLKIKFDELLTFLSLRTHAGLIRVIFEGELGKGDLFFANSSINFLKYGGQKGDEALNILLKEPEVNLIKLEDIILINEDELLYRIINRTLKSIKDYIGLVFLDDSGNILLQQHLEGKFLGKELINILKNLSNSMKTTSFVFVKEKGLHVFWAKIKDGLTAVALSKSVQSQQFLDSLFRVIIKITKNDRNRNMSTKTKKILIISEDREFLSRLREALNKYSYEIELTVFTSGKETLAFLERDNVDLIISDFDKGEMDGLQLLTIVARKYPHIPFILITGYGSPPIKEKAKRGGAIRYLEKPITIPELIKAIREVLNDSETMMNVSIIDISQLISIERKTCTLKIIFKENNKKGILSFREGKLVYAKTDKFEGLDAAVEIFSWENVNVFVNENMVVEENVNIIQNLEFIIIQAIEQKEKRARKTNKRQSKRKEVKMAFNYEKLMNDLKEIPGYKAAAVFNINGEQVTFDAVKDPDRVRKYFLQMTSLFVAGSKATEKTGAGEMDFIQTDSDIGKFLARKGEKFIVMILLDEDGNLALAKDALEEASGKL